MSYPEISSVILDATFDKMEPLAASRMPDLLSECPQYQTLCRASSHLVCRVVLHDCAEGYTKDMVKEHFALDIAEQLS